MNCPKCPDCELVPTSVGEIQVDKCPTCEGIWFDQGELGQLLGDTARHLQPLLAEKKVHAEANQSRGECPCCQRPLVRIRSAQNRAITLDTCADCHGIWLDGGEFNALRRA